MKLVEYADQEMMMIDLANHLAGELENCLLTHEHASFAVPGGTTPGPMFDALCAASLDWSRVHVLLTDERRVPPNHERSNQRLLRERLLTNRASEARYIDITADPDMVAELPISVMLLGMGADMHTASLFPGSPDLEVALTSEAPLMKVEASDGLEPRVTLTGPVLAASMSCHVLITGAAKRAALERAVDLDPREAPIATVLSHATIHWAP